MNMLYWFYAAIALQVITLLNTLGVFYTSKKKWVYLSLISGALSSGFLYYFLWQFFTGTVNGFSNVGDALNDVWGVMFQMMQKIGRT